MEYLRLNIDDYLLKDGQEPMSGPLDMSLNKITNLGNATADGDAVNKGVMDVSLNLRILKSGGSMTGRLDMFNDISMNGTKITNLGNATANGDAVNKSVMDLSLNLRVLKSGDTTSGRLNMFNDISMNGTKITNLGNATANGDAVNKGVMDLSLNLRVLKSGDTMNGNLILNDLGVNGGATVNQGLLVYGSYQAASGGIRTLSTTNNAEIRIFPSVSAGAYGPMSKLGDKLITFNDGSPVTGSLTIAPGDSTGIRITNTGNVGIATSDPSQKLEVSGNAIIGGNLGLGKTPSEKIDINGNINFTGRLMINGNSGKSGQVLVSRGNTLSPMWSFISYNVNIPIFNGGKNYEIRIVPNNSGQEFALASIFLTNIPNYNEYYNNGVNASITFPSGRFTQILGSGSGNDYAILYFKVFDVNFNVIATSPSFLAYRGFIGTFRENASIFNMTSFNINNKPYWLILYSYIHTDDRYEVYWDSNLTINVKYKILNSAIYPTPTQLTTDNLYLTGSPN